MRTAFFNTLLEAIFEEYEQASEITAEQYGGTGLGLPISQKISGRISPLDTSNILLIDTTQQTEKTGGRMKKLTISLMGLMLASLYAQDAKIAEKDVPKKVVAARNKKAAVLKNKNTTWSKNAAGEFVAELKIGGNPDEETPPDQTLTARFKEDGTWIETENVLSPYNETVKKKIVPKNIQKACAKLAGDGPFMPGGVTVKQTPAGLTVEASCGDRVTFNKKGKVVK
ncbi:MAG: hypothetical protein LDLANPLL_01584 [Turneriella sp.]|nr:hypothetical protein [Turneriella sp.]